MSKLPKFTLSHNEKKDRWELKGDSTDRVKKAFETKAEATAGGVLEKAVGKEGGSVKIQKLSGVFQEERTFPGSKDPKKSPG
jgi:hypothetical protein